MNRVFLSTVLVVVFSAPILIEAQVKVAEDGSREVDYHLLVDCLIRDLASEDLEKSLAAVAVLQALKESYDPSIRNRAFIAMSNFEKDAHEWLTKNNAIHDGDKVFESKLRVKKGSTSIDDFVLQGPDVDLSKLVFLRTQKFGSIALVDIPDFKDEHLVCLRDQDRLVSLTLEKTGVTGTGFRLISLPSTEVIFLTGSPVDDTGMLSITGKRIPRLAQLVIVDTEVSQAAVRFFKESSPARRRVLLRRDR